MNAWHQHGKWVKTQMFVNKLMKKMQMKKNHNNISSIVNKYNPFNVECPISQMGW